MRQHIERVVQLVEACAAEPERPVQQPVRTYAAPRGAERFTSQLILMIKPELLDLSSGVDVPQVLELVGRHMERLGLRDHAMTVHSAAALQRDRAIESHYIILNRVSRLGPEALAESATQRLEAFARTHGDEPGIALGGHAFLEQHQDFSAHALETICRNTETVKLGNGAYANRFLLDGERQIVLNAFHPQQLARFYRPGNAFLVVECRSELTWIEIRRRFIGETDPSEAAPQTLKALLHERARSLGLRGFSIGLNGVHVSPGPIDGMLSVLRFFRSASGDPLRPADTALGSVLVESGWTDAQITALESRTTRGSDGLEAPLIEITEDMSWPDALDLIGKMSPREEA